MSFPAATVAATLGLCFGSFMGVLVVRVPAGADVVRGRSRCDACGRTLGVLDLVPVLSWLALRGRCRTCGAPVSPLWTVLELASGAAFVLAVGVAPDLWSAALLAGLLGVLLGLTIIDLRIHRLPDQIVGPSAVVAIAMVIIGDLAGADVSIAGGLIGSLTYGGSLGLVYLIALRIYGHEAMGLGDVKVAALIGLVIGAVDLGSVGVAAGGAVLIGGLVAVVALVRGSGRSAAVPFGPMLAAGAVLAVAAGPSLLDAYLGLFQP